MHHWQGGGLEKLNLRARDAWKKRREVVVERVKRLQANKETLRLLKRKANQISRLIERGAARAVTASARAVATEPEDSQETPYVLLSRDPFTALHSPPPCACCATGAGRGAGRAPHLL